MRCVSNAIVWSSDNSVVRDLKCAEVGGILGYIVHYMMSELEQQDGDGDGDGDGDEEYKAAGLDDGPETAAITVTVPKTRSFEEVPRARLVVLDIDDTVLGANKDASHTWVVQHGVFDLLDSAEYVLFLTARLCCFRAHTLYHLHSIGIFARHEHIIYTNGHFDKGTFLQAFLQGLPHLQGLDTVFVDDNLHCITSMQRVMPHVRSCWLCPEDATTPPPAPTGRVFIVPTLSPP